MKLPAIRRGFREVAPHPQRNTPCCPTARSKSSIVAAKTAQDGPLKESKGKAEVVDTKTNAKLKVWFFWPFKGNYWIIDLDDNYQWAVVGEPKRKYVWILSRTHTLEENLYQGIISRLPAKGYDPAKLERTPQVNP